MLTKTINVICSLFILLSVIGYVNVADAAKDFVVDGLVAMYTLNEKDLDGEVVMDTSGNDNHAKLIGKLDFVEGPIGDAFEFKAAANNYVEIPDMGDFDFASVECYALQTQFGGIQGIVSTWQWVAGKVHFKFQENQIQVDKNGGSKIRFNAEAEKWYHIIYTTNPPDNELKLYVDGELVAEGAAGAQPENMKERRIGSEHDGRFLNGMVDNVRIYDRVLDEDEIMQNFEAKSDQLPVEPADKLSTTWGALKRKRI